MHAAPMLQILVTIQIQNIGTPTINTVSVLDLGQYYGLTKTS